MKIIKVADIFKKGTAMHMHFVLSHTCFKKLQMVTQIKVWDKSKTTWAIGIAQ